mgnify:CR=1 FL=1
MIVISTNLLLPFPAHAGLNRIFSETLAAKGPVPRTRGAEPASGDATAAASNRSPHTRG